MQFFWMMSIQWTDRYGTRRFGDSNGVATPSRKSSRQELYNDIREYVGKGHGVPEGVTFHVLSYHIEPNNRRRRRWSFFGS